MASTTGTQAVVDKLRRVHDAAVGVVNEEPLKRLLRDRIVGRFDEGVDPQGSPWPGLLASTLARKKRFGYQKPEQLLQATKRLRNSLGIINGTNTGLIAVSTGLGFRIGVRDKAAAQYGRIHNYGLAGQEQRRFLGFSALDLRSVRAYLRRSVQSIAKA